MSKPKKAYMSLFLFIFCMLLFTGFYGCGSGPDTEGGGTTPTPTPGTATLTLSTSSSIVTSGGQPVTATATLRDGNGALVSGAVVTFTAGNTLIVFSPVSATALTSNGTASITVNAADVTAGATSITASASVSTGGTTETVTSVPLGISVGSAAVTIKSLELGQSPISAYGTSSVTAEIYVNSALATVPISVAFNSSCVSSGKATLTTPVTTVLGKAISTYKDNGCGRDTDTISASVTGDTASTPITVAVPSPTNMQFVSATPTIIGIKGSPLAQSSLVKFQVVDSNGNGVPAKAVDFSLLPVSAPGGITLSPDTATSDISGYVTTSVSSGTVPTPVWVVAKVSSTPTILSQSNTLTITTGLPTQNFFSLSVQTHNIEGWDYDGITSKLTIIASDRLGNPIPNGTVINFITEGSQINPASCATTNGTCTVTFTSSASKPANGRVTLLAYAVGEKSFIASSPDNIYTAGDKFYDLGDIYLDANENGVWDAGETFIVTGSGTKPCRTHTGTPIPGVASALPVDYWNVPSKTDTCSEAWGSNYVRRSAVIVLSGSYPVISPTTVEMASSCTRSFTLMLTDVNGNPMPAGTKVSTDNNQVYYTPNGSTTATKASVSIPYGTPVLNTNALGGTSITLLVEANCTAGTPVAYPSGTLNITTTTPMTPDGIKGVIPITVTP